jgi:toxin CcdB
MAELLMARFDVYPNPSARKTEVPFVLNVQSDLLSDLGSRLVIPLRRAAAWGNVPLPVRLCPVFRIDGEDFVLETPRMAAVPAKMLKSAVCSLQAEQAQITAALDFVFQGY